MFGDMLSAVVDITRQPGNRKLRCAANADILPVGNCEGSKPCVRRLPMSKPDRSIGTSTLLNTHTTMAGYTSSVPPMLSQLMRAAPCWHSHLSLIITTGPGQAAASVAFQSTHGPISNQKPALEPIFSAVCEPNDTWYCLLHIRLCNH